MRIERISHCINSLSRQAFARMAKSGDVQLRHHCQHPEYRRPDQVCRSFRHGQLIQETI